MSIDSAPSGMLGFSPLPGGQRVIVRARAKVNLGLEVLGRRPDGYHELRTLLWPIELADRVTLDLTPGEITVACGVPGVPETPDNLAWRAAELLRRATGTRAGVRIGIAKAIPVGGGLGGGSADAAAVLTGLLRLWRVRLAPARLAALATELGMDVPFFLGRGPALGTGRGERLRAVTARLGLPLVVVNPGFPLATREVYGRLRPAHFSSGHRVRALVTALRGSTVRVAARLVNGLEAVAAEIWPGLLEVKGELVEAGCLAAVMSGSGPTVLGVAPSPRAATRIGAVLRDRPWRVWVTRTVAAAPLAIERPARPRSGS